MADQVKKTRSSKDRISNLPDAILCHILSFLPTKISVGSSILSTRWRYLFASVPNLDFDNHKKGIKKTIINHEGFMNFVDRVLFLHKMSNIEKFRLKCRQGQGVDSCRVYGWLCDVLLHDVRKLDLNLSVEKFTLLPDSLFTCKTLVKLKLDIIGLVLNVPMDVCFPNLKTLYLKSVEFKDGDSVQRMFSSCLVLEQLDILECEWKNIREFNVFNPLLKRLTLIDCMGQFDGCRIVINAPSLVYFCYHGCIADNYSLLNPHSLFEARVDFYLKKQSTNTYHHHQDAVKNLFKGINGVRILALAFDSLKLLVLCHRLVPAFSNLDTVFITDLGRNWLGSGLEELLECSPNLGLLGLYLGEVTNGTWTPPEKVPSCLLIHLKAVLIFSFNGQMEMVEYFLKSGRVLEKLLLKMNQLAEKEKSKITKELLALPRASVNCQINIL